MHQKQSLRYSKSERSLKTKKEDPYPSASWVNLANQVQRKLSDSSEKIISTTETGYLGVPKPKNDNKNKEATALAYLRDMSELESYIQGTISRIVELDADVDPFEVSDAISPFTSKKKKTDFDLKRVQRTSTARTNSRNDPKKPFKEKKEQIEQTEQSKKERPKKIRLKSTDNTRSVKVMKSKTYEFIYPKLIAKGLLAKIDLRDLLEEENNQQQKSSVYEKYDRNLTESDYHGTTQIKKEMILETMPADTNYLCPPSILQVRKLIGSGSPQLIKKPTDNQANNYNANQKNRSTSKVSSDRSGEARENSPAGAKISDDGGSGFSEKEHMILVGRSVSLPKITTVIENNVGKEIENPPVIPKSRKEKEDLDTPEKFYENKYLFNKEGINLSGSKTSRQSQSGEESTTNSRKEKKSQEVRSHDEIPKMKNEVTVKYHKHKTKSEISKIAIETRSKNTGDVNQTQSRHTRGSTDDLKKSQQNLLPPEREGVSGEKSPASSVNSDRRSARGFVRENKITLEKASKILNSKIAHIACEIQQKQRKRIILPEIPQSARINLRLKDSEFTDKDQRLVKPMSRRGSVRKASTKEDIYDFSKRTIKAHFNLDVRPKSGSESERSLPPSRGLQRDLTQETQISKDRLPNTMSFEKKRNKLSVKRLSLKKQ